MDSRFTKTGILTSLMLWFLKTEAGCVCLLQVPDQKVQEDNILFVQQAKISRLKAYKPREDADHHQCHLEEEIERVESQKSKA